MKDPEEEQRYYITAEYGFMLHFLIHVTFFCVLYLYLC